MGHLRNLRNARGAGGFTLVELLVVIAILATLAGVVTFAANRAHHTALVRACMAEHTTIISAIEAARLLNSRLEYPGVAGPDGLDAVRNAGALEWGPPSEFWSYARPAGANGLASGDIQRTNTARLASSDCDAA